jgi:hypothetical protein
MNHRSCSQFTTGMEDIVLWSCSGRDLILLAGGIFLLYKTTIEIRHKIEGAEDLVDPTLKKVALNAAIMQNSNH